MGFRSTVRRLLRGLGYDIVRFDSSSPTFRRKQLLGHYDIDLVFDVGANTGIYALDLRKNGYRGRIVSFEPLTQAFSVLQEQAAADALWEAVPLALGAENATARLNVSSYPASSSLLQMLPKHTEAAPWSFYTGVEDVTVRTLDDLFDTYRRDTRHIFLKMDVQGYEQQVLEGAAASLPSITGLQLEMSLVPLYEGERLFTDIIAYLAERGFTLMSVEPGLCHPASGQLLQVDGLFFRP